MERGAAKPGDGALCARDEGAELDDWVATKQAGE